MERYGYLHRVAAAAFGLFLFGAASALPLTVSGYLNDCVTGPLVYSDLGSAQCSDDTAVANNVALYGFSLATSTSVDIVSNGYLAGGIDPYFTLFAGTLGTGATFVASNFDNAFAVGGDFVLPPLLLGAGDYTLAIGAFANMSYRENSGAGTLDDGFIRLGAPSLLGNYYYEVTVSAGDSTSDVPEPTTTLLLVSAFLALARSNRRVMSI